MQIFKSVLLALLFFGAKWGALHFFGAASGASSGAILGQGGGSVWPPILVEIVFLLPLWWIYLGQQRRSRAKRGDPAQDLPYTYFVVLMTGMVVFLMATPRLAPFSGDAGAAGIIWRLLDLILLAPLVEEVLFRGVMLPYRVQEKGMFSAVLISSLLFWAGHMAGGQSLFPLRLLPLEMAFFLAYLRLRSGGLFAPVFAHMLANTITALSVFYPSFFAWAEGNMVFRLLGGGIFVVAIILNERRIGKREEAV